MSDNLGKEDQEDDGVISLDDLDTLLAEEDPDFSQEMKKISDDEDLRKANVEIVEFDEPDEDVGEIRKLTFLEKHPKLNKVITPLIDFRKKIHLFFVTQITNFKANSIKLFFWFKNDFPTEAKNLWSKTKDFAKKILELYKLWMGKYKALSKKQKTGLYTSLFFMVAIAGFISFSFKKSWIPVINEPLYTSLEIVADKTLDFSEDSKLKYLYRAFPQPEHIVQLDKFVVSLRRENNFSTPMAALELYLEVDSEETAVEIKDREKHVLDVVQRAIEEFTYKELNSFAGVSRMKTVVRSEINEILNQGRVNKVYQKTIILKP